MRLFFSLVENETLKILRRHRFTIVVAILTVVMGTVTYGQYQNSRRHEGEDWRAVSQQRIARYQTVLRRSGVNESWARSLRAEVDRLQFHLDHDIDPEEVTAPSFARNFPAAAGFLLLPLLISVLGSDIVSAESAEGTEKFLLTKPVRRWKILAAKLATLYLFTSLTLLVGGMIAYGISSLVFVPRGWEAPVFSGFQISGEGLQFDTVRQLPLWLDSIVAYGLQWFSLSCVATIALMLSVFFRSSSGSIGTMLAALIAGTILTRVSPDWTAGKYLFVSAVPVASYYSGQAPPYPGMSVEFCIGLLLIWAVASLAAAFIYFTRRDIYG